MGLSLKGLAGAVLVPPLLISLLSPGSKPHSPGTLTHLCFREDTLPVNHRKRERRGTQRRKSHLWKTLVSYQGQAQGTLSRGHLSKHLQVSVYLCFRLSLPRDGKGRSGQRLISRGHQLWPAQSRHTQAARDEITFTMTVLLFPTAATDLHTQPSEGGAVIPF